MRPSPEQRPLTRFIRFVGRPSAMCIVSVALAMLALVFGIFDATADRPVYSIGFAIALQIAMIMLCIEIARLVELSFNKSSRERKKTVAEFFSKNLDVIGKLAKKIDDDLDCALEVNVKDGSFVVQGRAQALETYHDYWALLAQDQGRVATEKKARPEVPNYIVRAIHSTDLAIWLSLDWLSTSIYHQHKSFCESGGSIERILVYQSEDELSDSSSNLRCAARKMQEVGVVVFALRDTSVAETIWRHADFMLIGFPGNDTRAHAVIWDSSDRDGRPHHSIYRNHPSHRGRNLNDDWTRYRNAAKKIIN